MFGKKDLLTIESIINREKQLISKYESYLEQIKEPQIRSDIQSMLAQHRNQFNMIIDLLEENK